MVNRKSFSVFRGLLLNTAVMAGVTLAAGTVTVVHAPPVCGQSIDSSTEPTSTRASDKSQPPAVSGLIKMNIWNDLPSEFLIRLNQRLAPHQRLAWMVDPELDASLWPGATLNLNLGVEDAVKAYCESQALSYQLKGRLVWIGRSDAMQRHALKVKQWLIDLVSEDTEKRQKARAGVLSLWNMPANSTQKQLFFAFLGHPDARKIRFAPLAEYGSRLPAPWVILGQISEDPEVRAALQKYVLRSESLARDPFALMLGSLIEMPEMTNAAQQWNSKDSARKLISGSWREWERNSMYRRYMPGWLNRLEAKSKVLSPQEYADRVKVTDEVITKMKPGKDSADRQLRSVLREMQRGYGMTWGMESDQALMEIATNGPHPSMREYALTLLGLREGRPILELVEARLKQDQAPSVRRAAAMALGEMRDEVAIQILKDELRGNESPIMRRNAAHALARSRHPQAAPAIIERLKIAEGSEAQALVQVLALTRDMGARDYLITMLKDSTEDLGLRQSAAVGLIVDPSEVASKALVQVLKSDAPRILRERTIKGLRPRNMQELNRYLPIMLSVLESEKEADLKIELLLGIHQIARILQKGDPRKVEIAERVLPIALDQSLDSNLRIKALESFKHTENPPAVIEALKKLEANENARVMKSFARIAAQQAAANPAPQQN